MTDIATAHRRAAARARARARAKAKAADPEPDHAELVIEQQAPPGPDPVAERRAAYDAAFAAYSAAWTAAWDACRRQQKAAWELAEEAAARALQVWSDRIEQIREGRA